METNALGITHRYMKQVIQSGDRVIDATAGNGHDTLFMAKLVGKNGHITAFDIQPQALENTKKRLEKEAVDGQVTLILDGHQNMKQYVEGPVKAVTFNFGYLPGGDHHICTHADTSIAAILAALELISEDGMVLLGIYYGGDSGFEEKDALMAFLKTLDPHEYSVLCHDFINYPNCPPLAVRIIKEKR
ncbi:MAG: methyltransferase domain-containing protein [Ruminococcaceae bacterium]|nr:methyltransferase domain-containing protein [Oscillospiraceae bacterium]